MSHQSAIRALHKVSMPVPAQTVGQRFTFLVLDGFAHLPLASALEPMGLANQLLGERAYSWRITTLTGAPASSSTGLTIMTDGAYAPLGRGDTLIVIGGPGLRRQSDPRLNHLLRREAAHGVRIGAFCMGVYALAHAGLLDGEECAVHWAELDGFAEKFPKVRISRNAFALGRRPTAPGGGVAADLMMHLISEAHGPDVATKIADLMICNEVRSPKSQQKVLSCMEANLETPLSAQEIADIAAMSVRQTERLFAQHLNTTPMNFYMQMRLEKARKLLSQTELSVTEIAVACGYKSTSHFTKSFRDAYGATPKRMRAVGN